MNLTNLNLGWLSLKKLNNFSVNEDISALLNKRWIDLKNDERLSLLSRLKNESHKTWEYNALYLLAFRECFCKISNIYDDNKNITLFVPCFDEFISNLECFLNHDEPRIRQLSAQILGLCVKINQKDEFLYHITHQLLSSIQQKMIRSEHKRPTTLGNEAYILLDDTTGWHSLETLISAFIEIVKVRGISVFFTTQIELLKFAGNLLLVQGGKHINRHVRQKVLVLICCIYNNKLEFQISTDTNNITITNEVIDKIKEVELMYCRGSVDCISLGLEDNWSQVRLAATKAARSMFSRYAITDDLLEETTRLQLPIQSIEIASSIIPRLCMNRFYVADGVKTLANETWRLVVGLHGKNILCSIIDPTLQYYCDMSQSSSHMVSEAACFGLSELACKLPFDFIASKFPFILDALELCIMDSSWPVQDAACLSLADTIPLYSSTDLVRNRIPGILRSYVKLLTSKIWSVRENSARAIGKLVKVLESSLYIDTLKTLKDHLDEHLSKVMTKSSRIVFMSAAVEAALTRKNSDYNNTILPVEDRERSIGNLIRRDGAWGCCLDCQVIEDGGDYECSDGCIYLLRELFSLGALSVSSEYLNPIFEMLERDDYKEAARMQTTVWKELRNMITSPLNGETIAKTLIEEHSDAIVTGLQHKSNLLRTACKETVIVLNQQFKYEDIFPAGILHLL